MNQTERLPGLLPVLILCCFLAPLSSLADDVQLQQQRKIYLQAKQFLSAGNLRAFEKASEELTDYPLYPYLLYDKLKRRLWKAESSEISAFLQQYGDLPMANDLRRSWLLLLVKRGHWQTYVDNYTVQQDKSLQCYQLLARMKTKNQAYLLEDIRTVWLAGESLPPECDPAFELLYKSELMTGDLVWQRFRLAMGKGQTGLATYLARKLGQEQQPWATRWLDMHHNPAKATLKPGLPDSAEAREILLYGMQRLVRQDLNRALSRWETIRSSYSFARDEIDEIDKKLAIRAARSFHKLDKVLLDKIDNARVDEEILFLRLRVALSDEDWPVLLKWTEGEPDLETIRLGWHYWHARALEQTGAAAAARSVYERLARERDYYGFLAADRIGSPYSMNNIPLPAELEEKQKLLSLPAIARAHELFQLGSHYSARREWHHTLHSLTSHQKHVAAALAAEWGWHDRAIITIASAENYDDLETRFPVPFREEMQQFSTMRKLDIAWLYALTRAESAFMEEVRSPAGALGLMQVMPATGQQTATRIGLKNYQSAQLLQAEKNVRIGTAYLRQMFDTFNRNMVLATASYNAGPANVRRWLPKHTCEEVDVWIEKIPFTETRKYVKRILFYSSVYDWRLDREIIPIRQRITLIQPHKQIVASKSCPVDKARIAYDG